MVAAQIKSNDWDCADAFLYLEPCLPIVSVRYEMAFVAIRLPTFDFALGTAYLLIGGELS